MNNKWLCNECASSNINIFKRSKREAKEMDCYCSDCKEEQYIVSSWWINRGVRQ
mgnify:FL=1